MKQKLERLSMGLLLTAVPALVLTLVALPSSRRLAALHKRINVAHSQSPEPPLFVPVTREERAFLEAPDAPWRSRIPLVADDGARLAQVDRVVNELRAALAEHNVTMGGIRLLMDPVRAEFTLPPGATREAQHRQAATDSPEREVGGWGLEVELPGATGDLFRALEAVSSVNALLEPGGLRWVVTAAPEGKARRGERGAPAVVHRQFLVLRNFFLKPGG